jgi:hypothetical protein
MKTCTPIYKIKNYVFSCICIYNFTMVDLFDFWCFNATFSNISAIMATSFSGIKFLKYLNGILTLSNHNDFEPALFNLKYICMTGICLASYNIYCHIVLYATKLYVTKVTMLIKMCWPFVCEFVY